MKRNKLQKKMYVMTMLFRENPTKQISTCMRGDTLQISKSSYTGEGAMGCTKETAKALALPPLVSIYIKA